MYVTVDKITWLPLLKQRIEALKPHVRKILHIPIPPRRRMGQKDVEAVHQHSSYLSFQDPTSHIAFGVLIVVAVIPHTSAEPQNAETFIVVNRVFDAYASAGRFRGIPAVMVPSNIEKGTVSQCDKKLQIGGRKISGGQNKINNRQVKIT
jgi:hypothetical protein